jgi:hypothetical protein
MNYNTHKSTPAGKAETLARKATRANKYSAPTTSTTNGKR